MMEALRGYAPVQSCDPVARYVRPNETTAFGRAHQFSDVRTYEDFVEAVPMRSYADLEPWIQRAADGECEALTMEDPVGFEITSGTSSAAKIIPITPTFQRELAMALNTWMRTWRDGFPSVFDGPAYWSLSPRLGTEERTRSGAVLGFSDDGAYFPPDVREALGRWLVVPDGFHDGVFESTALKLLETADLCAVSVWSPVFFLKLDEALKTEKLWSEIWPDLRVVSCWADAQAAIWRDRIVERLGKGIRFEPKGLLATEGVTSIPATNGPELASGVHFHEFIDCENGHVGTRIEAGRRYEVVLTTGSGLYRYRTGDVIERNTEGRLKFIGRRGDTSDLVGEKLDAEQVAAAFRAASVSGFVRVDAASRRYEIWSEARGADVLSMLRQNPHFAEALDIGQLEPCVIGLLPGDWQSQAIEFLANRRGGREGDAKLPVIDHGELKPLWVR